MAEDKHILLSHIDLLSKVVRENSLAIKGEQTLTDAQKARVRGAIDSPKVSVSASGSTLSSEVNFITIGDTEYKLAGSGKGEPDEYIKSASISNNTLTLTKKDDSTIVYNPDLSSKQDVLIAGANIQINGATISATDTTYSVATSIADGLMASLDKIKLDGINMDSKQDVISDLDDIRSGASLGASAVQPASISDMATKTYVTTSLASYSTTEQMNTAISNHHDSTKQDVLTAGNGITINNNNISTRYNEVDLGSGLSVSATTIGVDFSAVQAKLTQGANITISGNVISAVDTTYSVATTLSNGLMSADDKAKLEGLYNNLFYCTYDETTYEEISAALAERMLPVVVRTQNGELIESYIAIYSTTQNDGHCFIITNAHVEESTKGFVEFKVIKCFKDTNNWSEELEQTVYEVTGNKSDWLDVTSTIQYPTSKAVGDFVAGAITIKQDKLTAGRDITISTDNTISVSKTIPGFYYITIPALLPTTPTDGDIAFIYS